MCVVKDENFSSQGPVAEKIVMDGATHRINNRPVDKFHNAGQWDF